MTAYVETNFLLEIALEQEEQVPAREILDLAERAVLQLVIPAFCMCEPYETIRRRALRRDELLQSMSREMRELSRSAPFADFASHYRSFAASLASVEKRELSALESVLLRVITTSRTIALTREILSRAKQYEMLLALTPHDAIIYSSVIADATSLPADETKCFLSRNSRDFDDPLVHAELGQSNNRYIRRFADGLAFIQSQKR